MFQLTQSVVCYAGPGVPPYFGNIADLSGFTIPTVNGSVSYRHVLLSNGDFIHCREDFICASLEEFKQRFPDAGRRGYI